MPKCIRTRGGSAGSSSGPDGLTAPYQLDPGTPCGGVRRPARLVSPAQGTTLGVVRGGQGGRPSAAKLPNSSSEKEEAGRKGVAVSPSLPSTPGPQNASPARAAQTRPGLAGPDRALGIPPQACGQESFPGGLGGLAPGPSNNPQGPALSKGAGRWPWLPTGAGGGLC